MESKIKLLVVDDEERFLATLARRLTMRDFDVTAVSNGRDALEAARTTGFELALVDLKMPGMSGEEVLEALKQQDPLIEVIILTGHGSVESAVECVKAGSRHYLQKPCETETLLSVLREAYEARLKRKLQRDERKMQALERIALGESPLGILRRLKELDAEGE
jgi:DNA-binding NtrC family response regulator